MVVLHWNYRDLFRACRLGFSAKKIWMQMLGLMAGGAGYCLLTYLAYLAAAVPISAVWERFALVPFLDPWLTSTYLQAVPLPWWSWLLWCIGIAYCLVAWLITGAAVAKVTFEQLKGDDFFESREAFQYAFRRLDAIAATPLLPLAFVVLVGICGLILGLIGAIPEVGPILIGVFALPTFGASLFVVYLLLIFLATLILLPAIVGTTQSDTFDALFEVFSCANEQSWRLLVYSLVLGILAVASGAILGWFSLRAVRLGANVLAVFMGTNLNGVLSGGQFYLHLSPPGWCPLYGLTGATGMFLGGNDLTAIGVGQNVGALLVGVAAYAVLLFVVGYSSAVWNTGTTIIFCLLTRKKDDKDLRQEKDTEELLAELPGAETDRPAPTE